MSITISDLVSQAHETAVSKGWHGSYDELMLALAVGKQHRLATAHADRFGALMALIHTEVSEAVEAYRDTGTVVGTVREDGKPEGVPSELADILIRVADVAGVYGIDLEDAVRRKLEFNKSRPVRHGGKAL